MSKVTPVYGMQFNILLNFLKNSPIVKDFIKTWVGEESEEEDIQDLLAEY